MEKAEVWREIHWECPHCHEINELDACSGAQIIGWVERCPHCDKQSELND